ncbi:MAG: thioredoxin [Paludibacteraceae bacterium]|nr:thioredoxin [Paludibacteraceae bacterium]
MVNVLNDVNGKELLSQSEYAVVDFFATWCGPCRSMAPVVEQLSEANGEKVTFFKCDVDANPELSRAYGIQSIPTLVFLNEGREVERMVGLVPQHEIQAAIDNLQK